MTYSFETPQISDKNLFNNQYSTIKINKLSSFQDPGKPVIPVASAKILLPYGQELQNIEITTDSPIKLSLDYQIEPGQQFYPLNYGGKERFTPINKEIYDSSEVFPKEKYEIVSVQQFRGFNILILRLYPVQYLPKENKILYYQNMKISNIVTNKINKDDFDQNYRGLQSDFNTVKSMVDNPEIADTYPILNNNNIKPLSSYYPYLIITSEFLKNYNDKYNFQALCTEHTSRGLNSKIVTIEEIESEYTGVDTQQKIRNFIRYAHNNWNTEYVLLGGDNEIIPARELWAHGGPFWMPMAADIYYACLDGPYNYNNNGYWGEVIDGQGGGDVDLIADVYVGRASVENKQEVSNFVKKTLEYTYCQDDYIYECLWVGEHLGFEGVAEYAANMKDQNIGYCDADGYVTNGLPEDETEGYNVYRLYERDTDWDKTDLMSLLNQGYHLINHLGHANYNYSMKMFNEDIQNLNNNKYFFVYSQGCMAGGFDLPYYDCAAEYLTAKTSHGAFACIMNSHFGWGKYNSTDGPSQRFDREFWDAIYSEQKFNFGKANHDSKEDNLYRINECCMRWCTYCINLFGDPALHIWGIGSRLDCSGDLNFEQLEPGEQITDTIYVRNNGKTNTSIVWEISDWPKWGYWTFIPIRGENLTPESGDFAIKFKVTVPEKMNQTFTGKIRVVNTENPYDSDSVLITVSTSKNKMKEKSFFVRFFQNHPNLLKILKFFDLTKLIKSKNI